MDQKKSGWLYLVVMVSVIVGHFGLAYMRLKVPGFTLSTPLVLSVGEIFVLFALIFFMTVSRTDLRDVFRIRKVKLTTLLLVIPFTYLMMPLMAACNALTMLFTKNVVADLQGTIIQERFWVVFFIVAVFGPFVEEATFRGAIYSGFRKSRRLRAAILIQALMFGLFHMNLNQFLYAFVLGIFFGVLSEITNSIIPSFVGHLIVNGSTVYTMYTAADILPQTDEYSLSKFQILIVFFIYVGISLITTFIAVNILKVIAMNERSSGGADRWNAIFRCQPIYEIDGRGIRIDAQIKIMSIPSVIAMVLAAVCIVIRL